MPEFDLFLQTDSREELTQSLTAIACPSEAAKPRNQERLGEVSG